ncbi:AMP phosphorylase [Candidatus Woesearchaeota archaeon]|nr:AMP phosphorylase [Candidatus Woesearchaeota archaeon]
MKFSVKDMDIATGGVIVAILNEQDAVEYDLHHEDRIRIKKGRKETIAVLDISESRKSVPPGKIGLFEEALKKLNAKNNDVIDISLADKPKSIRFIRKKLEGNELNFDEINQIIDDVVNNKLTAIELTYYVSANFTYGMSLRETVALTKSMIHHGDLLKLKQHPVIDKHCIGGVAGNKTTMVIVPILAAAGLTVPKTSSRAITSPAGTADTMEVLANVSLSIKEIKKIVGKVGGCMVWGGAVDLAPADDTIINVEHPLSIDAEGQLLASILAKKGSVSATHVLIDIPIGKGTKITDRKKALHLKSQFEKIAKQLKMKVKVIITDGSQPIGNGIGPALEARDVLWILLNDSMLPKALKEKSLMMAGHLLEIAGKARKGHGKKLAREILESGMAYKKFVEIAKTQGAKVLKPEKIRLGKLKFDHKASKKGVIKQINNKLITRIARSAGAPRDKEAGIYLQKHVGNKVKKGQTIFTLYAKNKVKLKYAKELLKVIPAVIIK